MSNALSARRVKIKNLDENGNPIGEPSYGVLASDSYESYFCDVFDSFKELNDAINEAGTIIDILMNPDGQKAFYDVDRECNNIGTDNYYDCIKSEEDE